MIQYNIHIHIYIYILYIIYIYRYCIGGLSKLTSRQLGGKKQHTMIIYKSCSTRAIILISVDLVVAGSIAPFHRRGSLPSPEASIMPAELSMRHRHWGYWGPSYGRIMASSLWPDSSWI